MRKQHTEVENLPEVTQLKSDLPVWVWASSRQPRVLKNVLVKCLGVRERMRLRVSVKETKKILWCPGISSSRKLLPGAWMAWAGRGWWFAETLCSGVVEEGGLPKGPGTWRNMAVRSRREAGRAGESIPDPPLFLLFDFRSHGPD